MSVFALRVPFHLIFFLLIAVFLRNLGSFLLMIPVCTLLCVFDGFVGRSAHFILLHPLKRRLSGGGHCLRISA